MSAGYSVISESRLLPWMNYSNLYNDVQEISLGSSKILWVNLEGLRTLEGIDRVLWGC